MSFKSNILIILKKSDLEQRINDQSFYRKITNEQDLIPIYDKSNNLYNREALEGNNPLPLTHVFKKNFNTILFLTYSFNFLQPLWWDEEINTLEEQKIHFNKFKSFLNSANQNNFYITPSISNIKLALHFLSNSFSFDDYWQAFRETDEKGFQVDATAEVLLFAENGSWAILSDIHSELVFIGLDKELFNHFKTCFQSEIMSTYDVIAFLGKRRGGDLSENIKTKILNLYMNK